MKQHFFVVPVNARDDVSPEAIARLLQKLLDAGLAHARSTLQGGEGDVATAEAVLDISSPVHTVGVDVPDREAMVIAIGESSEQTTWRISQDLTDRWGDINLIGADKKPLAPLLLDAALLARLRGQMWDEATFVVRKDGHYGVLFEVEHCSIESDGNDAEANGDFEFRASLKPHSEVVEKLQQDLLALRDRFPGVEFAVPDAAMVFMERPAAWAFVPDGLLTAEQRQALGEALLSL